MHPVHAEALSALEAGEGERAEALLRRHLDQEPGDAQGWSELARVLSRGGDLEGAVEVLERSLELEADQAAVLTRLGAVLQHLGRLEEACGVLERAVAVGPDHAEAWCNLGIVRLVQGDAASLERGEKALERALELEPEHGQALRALVLTRRRRGRHRQALEPQLALLRLQPDRWEELMLLGQELEQEGLQDEAETAYRQAMAAASSLLPPADAPVAAVAGPAAEGDGPPPLAVLHAKLGVLLLDRDRPQDACTVLQQALSLAERFPEAHANLGVALRRLGRLEPSLVASERALELQPRIARFHALRGLTLRAMGRAEEACEALFAAVQLEPLDPDHLADLGLCLADLGRCEEAIDVMGRALARRPDDPVVLTNRGMCRLQSSGQCQGWDDYESRLRKADVSIQLSPSTSRWTGEDPGGAPLLLIGEQGLGDMIQALRYAPLLRQRTGALALCLPANLVSLAEASRLADAVWTPPQAEGHRGPWLPLFSLFQVLGCSPWDLPAPTPYLRVPEARLSHWRQRISAGPHKLVALHWQGNPTTETGSLLGRSLALEQLAPLTACGPLRFVSLQKGVGAEQRQHCSFRSLFVDSQDLIDTAWDFLDTAAILHCCDLLITSDSALAHLAGALGLPVWLLLKQVPDWRWSLQGETTPWYPSMRLFRQRRRGDWSEVIERVCQALPARLAAAS